MAKKQTSDDLSKLAARVLQPGYPSARDNVVKDAKRLAASVLSQDETKGRRKAAKKRK